MSDSNHHIKTYTAQDIDRYLNRQMSAHEMHALEKAALDDPFLADAIEGYVNTTPASVTSDIESMTKELDGKTNTRVVGMNFKRMAWSAAAAVIILLGATTTWFWLRPSAQNSIAQQTKEEKSQPTVAPPAQQDNLKIVTDTAPVLTTPVQKEPVVISSPGSKKTTQAPLLAEENQHAANAASEKDVSEKQGFAKNKTQAALEDKAPGLRSMKPDNLPARQQRTLDSNSGYIAAATQQAETLQSVTGYFSPYIFTGTITDNNNKPLPFVNISIANTPASTYSDAKGNFRLTSADSQLVVHLRSVGFEEKEITLASAQLGHSIQLQPQGNALNEVVITGYGSQKKRGVTGNTDVKKEEAEKQEDEPEAEPKDGWAAYDAYMMNNTRPPFSNPGTNLKGLVELSFTVNKYGMLTGFTVEKSTCTPCNNEAIRLIKEGPQWKLLSGEKPARVVLTMYF